MIARRRRVALLAFALVLPAACSTTGSADRSPTTEANGPTSVDPGSSTTSSTPTASEGPVPELEWSPCGGRFECADLEVPVDAEDPDGETLTIALNRLPATDQDQKIGSLIFNPGGPGGSGTLIIQQLLFPAELQARFDMVGFDPRGVGDSDPLQCNSHLQEIYDADPTMEDAADEEHFLEVSQQFVDECEQKYADLLPHLGTVDVAADLDRIRIALGEEKLNFVGYSYGTSIGQQYARLYPDRVRTMILDGVVDQSVDGVTAASQQAAGFERALANYIRSCDDDGCFDEGTRAVIDRVIAAAETEPIPAPDADRPATPGVVNLGLGYALYSEFLWSDLTFALRSAADGDASRLVQLADSYLGRSGDGSYDHGFEIYFAVSCLDSRWPSEPEDVFAAAERAGAESPTFGEAIVNDYARCSIWPTPPQPLEPVPTDVEGLAPVLVISTTGDPATPYENGVKVADQLPGARLVTYEGEGHTIFLQGTRCVDDVALDYLIDAEVPAEDLTC